ncbi:MAG: permease [Hyphomicrobiaceae bacterium]|nr:permease [Hyphomicrobiaceae bacterium]
MQTKIGSGAAATTAVDQAQSAPRIWQIRPGRLDRAWLAVGAIFAVLLAIAPSQAAQSATFVLDAHWTVLPFLLLSVAIAAYAKAAAADNLIAHAFQNRAAVAVILAALAGTLSPFCSCGVIPIIAALLAMGVPLGPVMAFWLSSPLMDPSMFIITAATLGTGFALAKAAAAMAIGLVGGFGVLILARTGLLAGSPLREDADNGGCAGSKVRKPKQVVWRFWTEPARLQSFAAGAREGLLFLGKWLTLAFVLESLMVAYVPADLVTRVAGGEGVLPVLGATLIGVPAYLNGYAALPLVAGLLDHGMAPGAAMAFLLAGGVTSLPAAIAVYAIARRQVFAAYIGFAFIGALAAGLMYGAIA